MISLENKLIKDLKEQIELERSKRLKLEEDLECHTRKLFENYNYTTKIFNTIGIGVIVTKEDGTIVFTNSYANEMLNIKQLAINLRIQNFISTPSNEDFMKKILSQKYNTNIEIECFLISGEKSTLPVNIDIVKMKRNKGNDEFIFSIKDLTEIRKREQKIKDMKDQLIESAYKEGIAENAVSVLHNIGNVLTSIMGRISSTKNREKLEFNNSLFEKLISHINKQNISLGNENSKIISMLNELLLEYRVFEKDNTENNNYVRKRCLHVSDIISSQQKYANFKDKQKVDLNLKEIVLNCLMIHEERIQKHNIDVNLNVDPLVIVKIEKIGLSQTLSNIYINAVDAILERKEKDPNFNSFKIEITSELDTLHNQCVLKVKDNGCGIEPSEKNKIFNFGFSTKLRGSGFGLHSCANFMQSNGGEIILKSEAP